MTLYHNLAGLQMKYTNGLLAIHDLNPEVKVNWRMSRWEMLILGLRCIVGSVAHGKR